MRAPKCEQADSDLFELLRRPSFVDVLNVAETPVVKRKKSLKLDRNLETGLLETF